MLGFWRSSFFVKRVPLAGEGGVGERSCTRNVVFVLIFYRGSGIPSKQISKAHVVKRPLGRGEPYFYLALNEMFQIPIKRIKVGNIEKERND
jgi:hypothetical protein